MATVSEVIASYLGAARIGHVFGYPGDHNVEVIEALRRADIRFVLLTGEEPPLRAPDSCRNEAVQQCSHLVSTRT